MNTSPEKYTLYLQIMNPESLEGGALPSYSFDYHGGTIGSKGANWLLHDYSGDIAAIHAEITLRDYNYCLIDRSGNTRVNSGIDVIGLNRIIQLNEGDTLQIGKYTIKARLQQFNTEFIDGQRRLNDINMSELIDHKKPAMKQDHLLAHAVGDEITLLESDDPQPDMHPDQILINEVPREVLDPLTAFSDQAVTSQSRVFSEIKQTTKTLPLQTVNVSHNTVSGENNTMSTTPTQTDDPHWSENYHPEGKNAELDHVIIAPLLRGMGISVEQMDTEKAHDFLIEVGQAIRTSISGIQALYQQEQNTTRNLALLSRNLQPIEDNPLRLKQSYNDTVDALFSPARSQVHLSPPAAIDESLAQLGQHQNSIIVAIQESLNTLLKAFSPDVLNKRFHRYAKTGENITSDDAWSWQMYNAYYSELISSRQTGFEKLFWEVFEQAYDRSMRETIHSPTSGSNDDDK